MSRYITKDSFRNVEKARVDGIARVSGVALNVTSRDSVYASGVLKLIDGSEVPFKIWDSELSQELYVRYQKDSKGLIFIVNGNENIYNGQLGVIVQALGEVNKTQELIDAFNSISAEVLESRKNAYNELLATTRNLVSEKGLKLLNELLFSDKELLKRFTLEYAAINKHDAVPVGLLKHTGKMLSVLELMFKQHGEFELNADGKDLVAIGLILHDIGKTMEYDDGVMSRYGYVGHRALGSEWLVQHKAKITEVYTEDFYYHLMSIIMQHHGKWEERPRTIYSYLVHLVDNFDTSVTIFEETLNRSKDLPAMQSGDSDLPYKLVIERDFHV